MMHCSRYLLLGSMVAAVVVSLVAVSGQSFWIDEGGTAIYVHDVPMMSFMQDRGSTLQMPGYMIGLWLWEKVSGHSERALRMFNLPWMMLAVAGILNLRVSRATILGCLGFLMCSPFLWFYLDETRPYLMQLGAATLSLSSLFNLCSRPPPSRMLPETMLLLTGLLLLSFSSLLAMLHAGLFLLFFVFVRFHSTAGIRELCSVRMLRLVTPYGLSFMALALYYLWTLLLRAGASSLGDTRMVNVAYSLYEFLGFGGLGPARNAIRTDHLATFFNHAPLLLLGIFTYLLVLLVLFAQIRKDPEVKWEILAGSLLLFSVGVLMMFMLGVLGGFRLLGRHMMPLFPLVVLAGGAGAGVLWRCAVGRVAFPVLVSLMLISSLNLRFHPRFANEDYRTAVMDAGGSEGTVWWVADESTAAFYQLPDRILRVLRPEKDLLPTLPAPQRVFYTRPDVFDPQSHVAEFMKKKGYRPMGAITGFTVWQSPE